MKRFIEIAHSLFDPEHPLKSFHTTFIVHKRKIISIGINKPKTHPTNLKNPTKGWSEKGVCSELDAINKLIKRTKIDTKDCRLINIRVDRNGQLNISKPCDSCEQLIRHYGFKHIKYSNELGQFEIYETNDIV